MTIPDEKRPGVQTAREALEDVLRTADRPRHLLGRRTDHRPTGGTQNPDQ